MMALSEPAPLDLRVNILKGTREDARAALAPRGWEARPTPLSPWGLRIDGRRPVTSGPAFQSGLVEIQDEGSQLVAALTDARPGMRVVDWCAGAGGKTLALAATMANRGQIVACDVSAVPAGGCGAAIAARRRHQCRAAPCGARRQMGEAAGGDVRSRAGRCTVHRHRNVAAQPGCAASFDGTRPLGIDAETVQHPRRRSGGWSARAVV